MNNVFQIWRGNLATEVRSSHGQPGIPHCCELVHGGLGAKDHRHSTRGLSTEKLQEICGQRHLLSSHRKGRGMLQHMNTVDPTGSTVFTREDGENNGMPFLNTKCTRKEDGSVKSVYRKKMHTDLYLNFASHHPKHQKLGVVMNRCEMITTEEDKQEEMEHLRGA